MQILTQHEENIGKRDAKQPLVATIGFFDGVHLGHQYLIRQVRKIAGQLGWGSAIVTFRQHPASVLSNRKSFRLLTSADEKLSLLEATGIDYIVLMNFTHELAQLSAKQYMKLLQRDYGIQALVIGYDHHFGHNPSLCFKDFEQYGAEIGMKVYQAEKYPNVEISSSAIRQHIAKGNITLAEQLLGRKLP
ncbi:MAG: FAD synthetase family protein [Bacteroidales bacterium]|nr:FAD synthetase family protein [Bacteroidales bacterium]